MYSRTFQDIRVSRACPPFARHLDTSQSQRLWKVRFTLAEHEDETENHVQRNVHTFQSTSVPSPPRLTHRTTSGVNSLHGLPLHTSWGIV